MYVCTHQFVPQLVYNLLVYICVIILVYLLDLIQSVFTQTYCLSSLITQMYTSKLRTNHGMQQYWVRRTLVTTSTAAEVCEEEGLLPLLRTKKADKCPLGVYQALHKCHYLALAVVKKQQQEFPFKVIMMVYLTSHMLFLQPIIGGILYFFFYFSQPP